MQLQLQAKPGPQATRASKHVLASPRASNILVIKISGKLCEETQLAKLAHDLKSLNNQGYKIVLIHGGGKQIDSALANASIPTVKKDGKRVTQAAAIPLIVETLAGINKSITCALAQEGIAVFGANGKNVEIVKATPLEGFERAGTATKMDINILAGLLSIQDVVVLSCIGKDEKGFLNVNADDVAQMAAHGLHAKKLILLSDVSGVLGNPQDPTSIIPTITPQHAQKLIETGAASGGMVEKILQCLKATEGGSSVVLASGTIPSLVDLLGGKIPCTTFVGATA